MPRQTVIDPKWSDDTFLDTLRASTDQEANGALEALRIEKVSSADTARLFQLFTETGSPLPPDTPAPIRAFLAATRAHRDVMVESLDLPRIQSASALFRTHAFQACIVMLAASLPSGYSAPCLAEILTISDELRRHPYRRLLGVVQLLVNIAQGYEDLDDSEALVTAQKLRLLHAGVRSVVPRVRPGYRESYGLPVNHEDMLATIMGFSYLVIEGLRRLDVEVSDAQAEDFWYAWRQFGRLMGIHPDGEPLSEEFLPQSYSEAAVFYASYVRRHFEPDPADNPQGVMLAKRNLEMMTWMIPPWLRALGLGFAPRIAMEETLGPEGMRRVGIEPLTGRAPVRFVFDKVLRMALDTERKLPDFTGRLSALILRGMITEELGGQVTFSIPMSVKDMQDLSKPGGPAVRRRRFSDVFRRDD